MTLLLKNGIFSSCTFFFASGKLVPVWCWEREVCPKADELPWTLVSIIWWNEDFLLQHHRSYSRLTIDTLIQFDVWPPPAVVAWVTPQNGGLWSVTQKWAVWCSQWAHSSPEVPTRRCPHLLPTRAGKCTCELLKTCLLKKMYKYSGESLLTCKRHLWYRLCLVLGLWYLLCLVLEKGKKVLIVFKYGAFCELIFVLMM